jgi:hypothetical protein
MPGFLLHVGATVLCTHGGQAMPTAPNPRVTLSGQPTVLLSTIYTIAGCPLVPPPLPPCVTGQWIVGTMRLTSNGQPLVVQSGQSICAPNGTPMMPVVQQTRVTAT